MQKGVFAMKMRRIKIVCIAMMALIVLAGCHANEKIVYHKYSEGFYDTFDTLSQIVGYTETEEEFREYTEAMHNRLQRLHKLFDIYNSYEGLHNIKTINDNAGVQPVQVDQEIIDLILFSKDWYQKTGGKTNIAMGAVLRIWHDYRDEGNYDPEHAELPPMEKLQEAAKHTDIDQVIVDTEKNTVYLSDEKMSLDVGAIAKGYAAEIIAQEAMEAGFTSGMISLGGNIRVLGKPLDGIRERWGVGIHDPEKFILSDEQNELEIIFLNHASVVSSGDYQRFYIVDGQIIHHLIDPETLLPGEYFRAVTVVVEDSGVADALSTGIFLIPYEQGRALVESIEGAEAIWVMKDGGTEMTDGMKKIMKSHGATGAKAE